MESKEKILKKVFEDKKGLSDDEERNQTNFKIKNWGFIDIKEGILLEQISMNKYIYNIKGKKGIGKLSFKCTKCETIISLNDDREKQKCSCGEMLNIKDHQGIYLDDYTFKLNKKTKEPIYFIPELEKIEEMLVNFKNIPTTKELFDELNNCLNTLFEFQNKADSKLCSISILFTYLIHHFSASYYLGIDATKGSGKTTLLEILSILSKHGFLADVSPASIPRLKDKYDLSIFIDEIDQLKNAEDIQGLLRKGQRRGNKYVRLNKQSLDEEIYEAFGFYAYSFRSTIEDAFKDRSILIRTPKAKDSRLAVINLLKSELLQPIFNKIFMWYIENIFVFSSGKSGEVVKVVGTFTPDHKKTREDIYKILTKDFSKEENELIKTLFGRNSEVAYLFIKISKFIGIDLIKEISEIMILKRDEEETPDSYYHDLIKEIFVSDIKENYEWLLSKGDFAGYRYFPKTKFYIKLVNKLKDNNLMGIGTPRYNSILKDIGFITNFNMKNQKVNSESTPCLIFEKSVLDKLNIDYSIPLNPETVKT